MQELQELESRTQRLMEKWSDVLDHPDLPKIEGSTRRGVVATLLENQLIDSAQSSGGYRAPTLLGEAAPTNATGASIDNYDPVLISLVRRSAPNLIAYDVCGVQPMTGPTGLIFAMRPAYTTQAGTEAWYNEVDVRFSASANNLSGGYATGNTVPLGGTFTSYDPTVTDSSYSAKQGMSTAQAEALGDASTNPFSEMAFRIDKISVTAVSRALKAEYTMELAQDLRAIHGLDAEQELSNILATEILAEINREVVRTINITAYAGAQLNTATTGTFDLDVDANGRWMAEKFKGLLFQIEREANQIARSTRRGKGNVMICSSDLASALSMTGSLDYTPALANNLNVDDTGNTFAGVLGGRTRVYIDPYFVSSAGFQYFTVGYKGSSSFDAGLFYCPYVPLQMVRAIGEQTFQPKIGFKTRYGMVANPFATVNADGVIGGHANNRNYYYRLVGVKNIM